MHPITHCLVVASVGKEPGWNDERERNLKALSSRELILWEKRSINGHQELEKVVRGLNACIRACEWYPFHFCQGFSFESY